MLEYGMDLVVNIYFDKTTPHRFYFYHNQQGYKWQWIGSIEVVHLVKLLYGFETDLTHANMNDVTHSSFHERGRLVDSRMNIPVWTIRNKYKLLQNLSKTLTI